LYSILSLAKTPRTPRKPFYCVLIFLCVLCGSARSMPFNPTSRQDAKKTFLPSCLSFLCVLCINAAAALVACGILPAQTSITIFTSSNRSTIRRACPLLPVADGAVQMLPFFLAVWMSMDDPPPLTELVPNV